MEGTLGGGRGLQCPILASESGPTTANTAPLVTFGIQIGDPAAPVRLMEYDASAARNS